MFFFDAFVASKKAFTWLAVATILILVSLGVCSAKGKPDAMKAHVKVARLASVRFFESTSFADAASVTRNHRRVVQNVRMKLWIVMSFCNLSV